MDSNIQSIISNANEVQATIDQLNQRIADAWLNALVFPDLDLESWILASGTVANSPGSKATAVGLQGQTTDKTAFFHITPNQSYADLYWYQKRGAHPERKAFRYEGRFLMPSASDAAASQAVELDIQQVISGRVFNTGLQFNFQANQMRVWSRYMKENKDPNPWVETGVNCPRWVAGKWNSFILQTDRDDKNVFYEYIVINGVRTDLAHSWPAVDLGFADALNHAIQLDSNSKGSAYTVCIGGVKFSAL